MKKILSVTALALAAAGMATPALAADTNDRDAGSGVNAADNWNFSAADVCIQELAVVPALADRMGDHRNNCANGNVLDRLR